MITEMRKLLLGRISSAITRPLIISIITMITLGCVMVLSASKVMDILLGAVIALIAIVLVVQVHWAVRLMRRDTLTVRQAAIQAEQHYIAVLRRIVRLVESRDKYSHGHSMRVGKLAGRMSMQMNFAPHMCEAITVAGELLDIGLLAISDELLGKRVDFGVQDFRSVQKHSEISYEVLKPLESLQPVLMGIRYHHERMNGTGYPKGLLGDKIPLVARILAVADGYDAMTHDRPHRPAMSSLAAMQEIRRCTPAGFDPDCVEAMGKIVNLEQLQQMAAVEETCQMD